MDGPHAQSALAPAEAGDEIAAGALQPAAERLLAIAASLDPGLRQATDLDTLRELGHAQQALRSQAAALVARRIGLLAGAARITAGHVSAAAAYAEAALARIADWRERARQVDRIVGFLIVLAGGDGRQIVEAAGTLKRSLDAAAGGDAPPGA